MKKAETIIKEYEKDRTQYLDWGREILQRLMDANYKEGIIEEGDEYRKAIVELDKKFEVDKPIDRLPVALVKINLEKRKVTEIRI